MRIFKARPIPKTLGAIVDRLYRTRQNRLDLGKSVNAMSEYETAMKDFLISTLPKNDASGVAGHFARAQVTTKKVPKIEDWDKLYAFIKETDAFELIQKRLNDQAIIDRWEAGEDIPGVTHFQATTVSVTKIP